MNGRVRTAVSMGIREFRRTPVLLALLAFTPAYVIGAFVLLVPDATVPVVVDGATVTVRMPHLAAAFMTPVTVAILAGIVGLFLAQSSRAADDRLRSAGFSPAELLLARVGTLGVGSVLATGASVAVTLLAFSPERLGAFVAATVLVGITYGILGTVVGVVLDELGGVYVMLFVPMVDVFVYQNPLATDLPAWTSALPAHFATNLVFDAAFTVRVDTVDLVGAGGYAATLLLVGVAILYRATGGT